jgi:hypothetical protein
VLDDCSLLLITPNLAAEQSPKTVSPTAGMALVADESNPIVVMAEPLRSSVAGAMGPQASGR